MPTTHICESCKRSFSRKGTQHYRFCGHACYSKSITKSPMKTLHCRNCGATISRREHAVQGRANVYCSPACFRSYPSSGYVNKKGYRIITVDGKQVSEHRHIFEQHLKRKLRRNEHVHHLNGDTLNNEPSNLGLMSHSEHSIKHHPLTWNLEVAKEMFSQGHNFCAIGGAMGVSYQAIRLVFIRRGVYTPARRRP